MAGVRAIVVGISAEDTVKYPELVARQVEMAIAALKADMQERGLTFGKVVDGQIMPGYFVDVRIVVESIYLDNEDDTPDPRVTPESLDHPQQEAGTA